MSRSTRATLVLTKLGMDFTVHHYDYDPTAERTGIQAAEAIGIEPRRLLETLMAAVDGKPVCVTVPSLRLPSAVASRAGSSPGSAAARRFRGGSAAWCLLKSDARGPLASVEEPERRHPGRRSPPAVPSERPDEAAGGSPFTETWEFRAMGISPSLKAHIFTSTFLLAARHRSNLPARSSRSGPISRAANLCSAASSTGLHPVRVTSMTTARCSQVVTPARPARDGSRSERQPAAIQSPGVLRRCRTSQSRVAAPPPAAPKACR